MSKAREEVEIKVSQAHVDVIRATDEKFNSSAQAWSAARSIFELGVFLGEHPVESEADVETLDRNDLVNLAIAQHKHLVRVIFSYTMALNAFALESLDGPGKARSRLGKKAAASRTSILPKQQALASIRTEWERWQRREVSYRSDAEFGRKMHLKHPEFTSDRSIANRSAEWRKAAKIHPAR